MTEVTTLFELNCLRDDARFSQAAQESLLTATLGYISRGWPTAVMHGVTDRWCSCGDDQCARPGRHPLDPDGILRTTLDPATAIIWLARRPHANIAIATGAPSGINALVVDPRDGGYASLARLEQRMGSLADLPKIRTGDGGLCVLIRRFDWPVSSVHLGPGLRMVGEDDFIIMPPSRHVSGSLYKWLGEGEPYGLDPLPSRQPQPAEAGHPASANARMMKDAARRYIARNNRRWRSEARAYHPVSLMLAPIWKPGMRHRLALHAAGELAMSDYTANGASHIISEVCDLTDDDERDDRLRAVSGTFERYKKGRSIAGLDRLEKLGLLEPETARELREQMKQ